MVKTPEGQCSNCEALNVIDALAWQPRQLEGLETARTLSPDDAGVHASMNEGNPERHEFLPNQAMLNTILAGSTPACTSTAAHCSPSTFT